MAGGAGILINIDVPDLKRGIAFYEGGLGFTLLRTLFGGAVAEMARAEGGPRLYLIEAAEGSNAVPRPDTLRADTPRTDASRTYAPRTYSPHWTPVHLDIAVDDIDAALAQALAAGRAGRGRRWRGTGAPWSRSAIPSATVCALSGSGRAVMIGWRTRPPHKKKAARHERTADDGWCGGQ